MRTLIFDTETTGMVNHKSPNHTVQPYPVQIACLLVEDTKVMNMATIFVDPGIPIDKGAYMTHGISDDTVKEYGLSLKAATGLFINFIKKADRIVAHNIDFDIIVTEAMIVRTLAAYDLDNYRQIPRVCTMLSSTEICKIPGKYGYKWPTLEEAYKILVGDADFSEAHDAYFDVMASWKILRSLEKRSVPLLKGKR